MKTTLKRVLSVLLALLVMLPSITISFPQQADAAFARDFRTGDTIYYGSYPQKEITDPVLVSVLGEQTVDSKGDFSYKGSKYRKKVSNGTAHFYLFEPIAWRVLSVGENGLFVLSMKVLNYRSMGGQNWANSTLRPWLNDSFMNEAFSAAEISAIRNATILNPEAKDTTDRIFVPSLTEMKTTAYGFTSNANESVTRQAIQTDYASAQPKVSSWYGTTAKNRYWLRTDNLSGSGRSFYLIEENGSINTNDSWGYFTSNSSFGVRPAMRLERMTAISSYQLKDSPTAQSDTEEQNAFIKAHKDFIQSSKYNNLIKDASFYYNVWSQADTNAALMAGYTWDALKVIGKPFTSGLKAAISAAFPGLHIELIENPYTQYFIDLLSDKKFKESFLEKTVEKFDEVYDEVYEDFSNAVKSDAEWSGYFSNDFSEQLQEELKKFMTTKDGEYQLPEKVSDFLCRYFDSATAERLKPIFSRLKDLSIIVDLLSKGTAVLNAVTDAMKAYITAISMMEALNEDFFTAYEYAVEDMAANGYGMNASLLEEAIGKLNRLKDADACFEYAIDELKGNLSGTVLDLMEDFASYNIIRGIASLLGKDPGPIGALSFAYNATYKILDLVTANGKKSDLLKTMFAFAALERSLYGLTTTSAAALSNNQFASSVLFDSAWNALRQVNAAAYKTVAAYAKVINLKTRFIRIFNSNYGNDSIGPCLYLSDEWKNASCHDRNLTTGSKIASVHCPVDVFVYHNNTQVLAIEDELITKNTENLTTLIVDGEKDIVLPSEDYRIRVIARENGTMDYCIYETEEEDFSREVVFHALTLEEGIEYSGSIPTAVRVPKADYALTTGGNTIQCDYDSMSSCADGSHQFGNWTTVKQATCSAQGSRERICGDCGKTEQMIMDYRKNVHADTEIRNASAATCSQTGYTGDEYCVDCDSLLSTGNAIPATGKHTAGAPVVSIVIPATCAAAGQKNTVITCTVCGEKLSDVTENMPPVSHTDTDDDGRCDFCGQEMAAVGDGQHNDVCRFCQTVHPDNIIGKLTAFFHNILYSFAHLFGKM